MINKSYKHWMIVFFMCCLAASSIGLCTNAIGVFYTPVSKIFDRSLVQTMI